MTDRELMQQALDALECMNEGAFNAEIEALRARLAQPEPDIELTNKEKIVYDILCSDETLPTEQHWEGYVARKIVQALAQPEPEPVVLMDAPLLLNGQPLYSAPPQREWQGLTDEEIKELRDLLDGEWISYEGFAHAIEAKLKEKNS